jgi:hypothetical protein
MMITVRYELNFLARLLNLNLIKDIQMKVSSKKFKPEYVVPHNIVRSNEKGAAEYEVKKVLDSLTAERQHWETNVYKTSIEALYALLQKCYSFECQLRNNVEGASDRRKALNEYTRNLGFSFKSDTPLINRVVRCVFGDIQRSRVSNYAKVLRRAKQDSVEPEDIPNYITENGGIDAIRLKASPTYKSSAVKAGKTKCSIYPCWSTSPFPTFTCR